MIEIKEIQEPLCHLCYNYDVVGTITSGLQMNDVRIQIRKGRLSGYSIYYEGRYHDISSDGRVEDGSMIYPLIGKQLMELLKPVI